MTEILDFWGRFGPQMLKCALSFGAEQKNFQCHGTGQFGALVHQEIMMKKYRYIVYQKRGNEYTEYINTLQ